MPINLFGNWIDIQREPLVEVRENLNYELTLEVRPTNRSYDLLFAEGKSPNGIANVAGAMMSFSVLATGNTQEST